jgi:hypothetical protein
MPKFVIPSSAESIVEICQLLPFLWILQFPIGNDIIAYYGASTPILRLSMI